MSRKYVFIILVVVSVLAVAGFGGVYAQPLSEETETEIIQVPEDEMAPYMYSEETDAEMVQTPEDEAAPETPGLAVAEEVPRVDTLEAAVQRVLVTHPEIRAAAYGRRARDWEVVQSRASFLPSLDGYASWGYMKQDRPTLEDDDFWPRQHMVSLRQNVFRGGSDLADLNRQKSRVVSHAYLVRGTSDNVALLTTRVYMNVLRSMALHELARENLINHERIVDQLQLRLGSGVDARAEMDQVMGRLALAKSNVVVTATNLQDAITDFQAVVGLFPEDLAAVEPLDFTMPEALADAETLALENHPIIKSAEADLEARRAQYDIAKRRLSPSVDVSADYNWDKDVWPVDGKRHYFSAAATVSMNFFAGGRDSGRIRETLYLIREAEEILENTRRQTAQSIRLSWEANQAARDRVVYLEDYAQAAAATAEAFATQWNIGRRTMFDLLDTQAEAINARSDLIRARYDLMYSEFRILNAMGTLVHALGLDFPEEGQIDEKQNDMFAEGHIEDPADEADEASFPDEGAEDAEDAGDAADEEDVIEEVDSGQAA